ncbi:hypothetical protein ACH47C_25595 [Streptomyces rishiriensis]|uniref:hypothetical protein n=1 Tax=Streptomyces rishiriensis TaxID=68264 RepID=UPI0037BAF570
MNGIGPVEPGEGAGTRDRLPHTPGASAPAARSTRAELPFTAQTVDVSHVGEIAVQPGTRPRTIAFEVLPGVRSGPPLTVATLPRPARASHRPRPRERRSGRGRAPPARSSSPRT